jgi:CHASE1-domain containing sensor protein
MLIIIVGIFISLALFYYIQKKNSDRNMKRFERSRDKYEELLQRLRNAEEEENNPDKNSTT